MESSYLSACQGLKDANGEVIAVTAADVLDADVRARYIESSSRIGLEALSALDDAGSVALKMTTNSLDHIAVYRSSEGAAEVLLVDDGISYEQLSPLQLIEYTFDSPAGSASPHGPWMVSNIGLETLEAYKMNKFSIWKNNMMNAFGGCAAAFLPEIKRGYALSNVYDHMIFTSPAEEKAAWETEHNGKMVSIPRGVAALRTWDSSSHAYQDVDPRMPGAPDNSDLAARDAFWQGFLQELRETLNPKYGDDFVDDCLALPAEEVKGKYF